MRRVTENNQHPCIKFSQRNPIECLTWINSSPQISKKCGAYQPNHATEQWKTVRKTSKGSESEQNCFLSNHRISFWSCTVDEKIQNYSCQPSQLLGTAMWQQGCMTAIIFIITKTTPLVLTAVKSLQWTPSRSFCKTVILQNQGRSRAKRKKMHEHIH